MGRDVTLGLIEALHTLVPLWPLCMTQSAASNWPDEFRNAVFVSLLAGSKCCLHVCLCAYGGVCVRPTVLTSTLILTDTLIWMGNRAFYQQFVWVPGGGDGCATFACVCVRLCNSLAVPPLLSPRQSAPLHPMLTSITLLQSSFIYVTQCLPFSTISTKPSHLTCFYRFLLSVATSDIHVTISFKN